MSEGWYLYAVLLKHCYANVLLFLLKLCKFDCRWGKLYDFDILKFDKF